jgi:hypothetical protein
MASWAEFERGSREVAEAGRGLLYQFGIGLGYLATVRKDGGPRLHPFCPVIFEGGLYGLIAPSPKQRDLLRDGRYAVHSFPRPDRDDEFYITGTARHLDDSELEEKVRTAFEATGGHSDASEALFEFDIERAMLATYKPRAEPDTWPPKYTVWRDEG